MPSRATLSAVLVVVWGLALAAWGLWLVDTGTEVPVGGRPDASHLSPSATSGLAMPCVRGDIPAPRGPERARAAVASIPSEPERSRLTVRLLDETGRPTQRVDVRLWRLVGRTSDGEGADRIEERTTADASGELDFPSLRHGRYRLQVIGLREGAEDPPAFEVARDEALEFRVAVARSWDMVLEMRMQDGTTPSVVEVRGGGAGHSGGAPESPDWARPAPEDRESYGLSIACGRGRPLEWTPAVLCAGGLPLGAWTERTREGGSRSHTTLVRAAGCGTLSCRASTSRAGPGSFVGWLPREDEFVRRVVLPDGSSAAAAAASIEVECLAVRRLPEDPADHWKSAPIRITAKLDGYESLDATFRPLLGEAPSLIMRRK